MIGIAGAGIRSGATHNSIVLGNFLRANNQMTAVLEYAQRPALQSVCEATGASFYNEGYFSLRILFTIPTRIMLRHCMNCHMQLVRKND